MAATLSNTSKPAPRWFRKLKTSLTILSDTAVVMLLSMGHQENSFIMLWCRVGLSGVLTALEALLANGEVYAVNDERNKVIIIPVDNLPDQGTAGVWYYNGGVYYYWNGSSFSNGGIDRPKDPPPIP